MSGDAERAVTVVSLVHDLRKKQSFVTLVWDGDVTKHVTLPVPFGVSLNEIDIEAERALRLLAAETARLIVSVA